MLSGNDPGFLNRSRQYSDIMYVPESKSSTSDVLVAVVNYNQDQEIGQFLDRLSRNFSVADTVIIDDCSSDRSAEVARSAGYHLLSHSSNQGVGAAIRTGIQYARERGYTAIAIMSSNGKMRPEELDKIISPVRAGVADYVVGSRFLAGGSSPGLSLFRRVTIPLFSLFAWPLLGRRFSDVTCGFRCYNLKMFDDPRLDIDQPWLNRYEMEFYIHYWGCVLGMRFQEVAVTIPYNHLAPDRVSKIRPLTGWWSIVRPLILLRLGIKS